MNQKSIHPIFETKSNNLPFFKTKIDKLRLASYQKSQELKTKYINFYKNRYSQFPSVKSLQKKTSKQSHSYDVSYSPKNKVNFMVSKFKQKTQKYKQKSLAKKQGYLSQEITFNSVQKNKNEELQQNITKVYCSKNLDSKMNEYLNLIIMESQAQFQQMVTVLQQKQQQEIVKNRKYASQNHYYKLMKISQAKRKRNRSPKFQKFTKNNYQTEEKLNNSDIKNSGLLSDHKFLLSLVNPH